MYGAHLVDEQLANCSQLCLEVLKAEYDHEISMLWHGCHLCTSYLTIDCSGTYSKGMHVVGVKQTPQTCESRCIHHRKAIPQGFMYAHWARNIDRLMTYLPINK